MPWSRLNSSTSQCDDRAASKSSPPRWVSPLVVFTSNTPSAGSSIWQSIWIVLKKSYDLQTVKLLLIDPVTGYLGGRMAEALAVTTLPTFGQSSIDLTCLLHGTISACWLFRT